MPLLAAPLTYIFNLSFLHGIYPSQLKKAIVVPIFKSGQATDPGNYRPISILTSFAKLLEKFFYNRFFNFLSSHNVLNPRQFGFQPKKSTNTAIANVLSTLINNINSDKHVAFILFDLKKAFDLINHDLLLNKLKHYGIRGIPHKWIKSFLSNRTQKVKCNNSLSDVKLISAGTPQGSVLSALLFILFINDIFQLETDFIDIFLYADDTAVIIHANSQVDLQIRISSFIATYLSWCNKNCIIINPKKSEFLTFNTYNIQVIVNGEMLSNPGVVKYLGIYIDDMLKWNFHVNHVTKICSQRIGLFKKVLPFLPLSVAILYYNCFIRTTFSYGLIFWFGNDRSGKCRLISKLEHFNNYLCKVLNCDVNHLLFNFRIFGISDIYKMQCLSFMYDVMNNRTLLSNYNVNTNELVHKHFTRGRLNLHIDLITSIDYRNFLYRCTLIWNSVDISSRFKPKKAFINFCKINILNGVL